MLRYLVRANESGVVPPGYDYAIRNLHAQDVARLLIADDANGLYSQELRHRRAGWPKRLQRVRDHLRYLQKYGLVYRTAAGRWHPTPSGIVAVETLDA